MWKGREAADNGNEYGKEGENAEEQDAEMKSHDEQLSLWLNIHKQNKLILKCRIHVAVSC